MHHFSIGIYLVSAFYQLGEKGTMEQGGRGPKRHVPPIYLKLLHVRVSKKKVFVSPPHLPPPQYRVTNGAPPISKLLHSLWEKFLHWPSKMTLVCTLKELLDLFECWIKILTFLTNSNPFSFPYPLYNHENDEEPLNVFQLCFPSNKIHNYLDCLSPGVSTYMYYPGPAQEVWHDLVSINFLPCTTSHTSKAITIFSNTSV